MEKNLHVLFAFTCYKNYIDAIAGKISKTSFWILLPAAALHHFLQTDIPNTNSYGRKSWLILASK